MSATKKLHPDDVKTIVGTLEESVEKLMRRQDDAIDTLSKRVFVIESEARLQAQRDVADEGPELRPLNRHRAGMVSAAAPVDRAGFLDHVLSELQDLHVFAGELHGRTQMVADRVFGHLPEDTERMEAGQEPPFPSAQDGIIQWISRVRRQIGNAMEDVARLEDL